MRGLPGDFELLTPCLHSPSARATGVCQHAQLGSLAQIADESVLKRPSELSQAEDRAPVLLLPPWSL